MENGPILLIVEDSITEQQALKRKFSELGFNVVCTHSGEEAVKLAQLKKPNVVIIDTVLPDMDGFQVCKKIKALEEVQTKIVVNTGKVDAVDVSKAKQNGADDYCVKTSDFSALIKIVKEYA